MQNYLNSSIVVWIQTVKTVNTHPPNNANFSFPSTLQHKMLPLLHTFQVFEELVLEDSVTDSGTSMDLMLAFPLLVHVSRLKVLNNNEHILVIWQYTNTKLQTHNRHTHAYIHENQLINLQVKKKVTKVRSKVTVNTECMIGRCTT